MTAIVFPHICCNGGIITDLSGSGCIPGNLGLRETINQATGALQKERNGADIQDKNLFVRQTGAARAFSAGISIGGDGGQWTTTEFISWLESKGAFEHPYWICKGSWDYAGNKVITDTGCGNICLAGSVIEVMGTRGAMTIRVTTPTTTAGDGAPAALFTYINHGPEYLPGWRRDWNRAGDTMTGIISHAPGGAPAGSGAFAGQLTYTSAPFVQAMWEWTPAAGGHYVPLVKGLSVRRGQGYPAAVSFGYLLKAEAGFPSACIHIQGDNTDALWLFDPDTKDFVAAGKVVPRDWSNFDSRYVQDVRLGSAESVWAWNGPGFADASGYVLTAATNGNTDPYIDTLTRRPLQKMIGNQWYNVGSL